MLNNPINKTIIRIRALMVTLEPLEAWVFGDAQRNAVFGAQLLQLSQHAVCHDGDAFGVEAVHHCRNYFKLVLDGVREEVRVDQDGVRGC